jgi:hypothetical protein
VLKSSYDFNSGDVFRLLSGGNNNGNGITG